MTAFSRRFLCVEVHCFRGERFGRAFSKARAGGGRGALLAVATAKLSWRRFFLPSFFFAPVSAKEIADVIVCSHVRVCLSAVVSPLFF